MVHEDPGVGVDDGIGFDGDIGLYVGFVVIEIDIGVLKVHGVDGCGLRLF